MSTRCRRRTSDRYIRERLAMIEGLCREDQVTVIVMYMREHGDKVEAAAQAMTRGFALGAWRRRECKNLTNSTT